MDCVKKRKEWINKIITVDVCIFISLKVYFMFLVGEKKTPTKSNFMLSSFVFKIKLKLSFHLGKKKLKYSANKKTVS